MFKRWVNKWYSSHAQSYLCSGDDWPSNCLVLEECKLQRQKKGDWNTINHHKSLLLLTSSQVLKNRGAVIIFFKDSGVFFEYLQPMTFAKAEKIWRSSKSWEKRQFWDVSTQSQQELGHWMNLLNLFISIDGENLKKHARRLIQNKLQQTICETCWVVLAATLRASASSVITKNGIRVQNADNMCSADSAVGWIAIFTYCLDWRLQVFSPTVQLS